MGSCGDLCVRLYLGHDVADGAAAVAAIAEEEACMWVGGMDTGVALEDDRSLSSARWTRTERDGGVEVVARNVTARQIDDEEHEAHGDCVFVVFD